MSQPRRPRRGVSPLAVLGVVLVVAALLAAGWGAWLYWGSTVVAGRAAAERVAEVRDGWASDAQGNVVVDPRPGTSHWVLRIPALGDDWEWPVTVGVDDESLAVGLGWYPRTAQPGQVGNFALAGGCITGAQPFRNLHDLAPGDDVLVEGADAVHSYQLITGPGDLTVADDETWVLDPVPGQDETEPTQALVTLTTCEDLYPTPDRSVLFGVLTSTEPR